ncbi:MAG: alpha/beta fold hydrolase [Rhizomicrobium sp.]
MNRRTAMKTAAALATAAQMTPVRANASERMPTVRIKTADDVFLFSKDWGAGQPLVFVHSWAVTNDIWQYQHAHYIDAGYRVIAFDRRGHGRSEQPGSGYDIDMLADDLAAVLTHHQIRDAVLIGHSMGCNEIVRYLARHGSSRVAKIALVAPTTPCLLKRADNPDGLEPAIFEAMRAQWRKDFPGWLAANARPFFMPETPQAMVDWGIGMIAQTPVPVAIACNRAITDNDLRPDCRGVSVPALIVHGTADASAPLEITGKRTAALIPRAELKIYENAPHGVMLTHVDRLNADLETFIKSR